MDWNLSGLNLMAVIVSLVAAQIISTVWFVALFGTPWAQEYGAATKQQHTKEIPPYTYGVQVVCTAALVLSLALLQRWLAVDSVAEALQLGLFVSIGLCIATGLPGQAFLKRWRVAAIAYGSQVAMILAVSVILAIWQ